VFPYPDDLPTKGVQPLIGVGIPEAIGFDLFPPENGIALRPGGMLGTAMPEATVDEYGDTNAGKYDICDASGHRQQWHVEAIAQASGMQNPAKV
jgi:hypothetical protein